MHPRTLLAAFPLSLLAACGGSGSVPEASESSSSNAIEAPIPASDIAQPAPGQSDAPAGAESAPVTAAVDAPPEFAICKACHAVEPGKNGVGPTLFGIVGSKAGEVPDYSFSPALKASGITWNRDTLDQWLAGPMKMVPGTKMVIAVPDPAKRKAIIDYLEQLK